MDTQRLSAILLIAGFAVFVIGVPFSLPSLYKTTEPTERVEIIEQYKTRWNITQSLAALGILLTTAGFFVLNTRLNTVAYAWVPTLGAAAFIIGAISAVIYIYA
jgi:hypothetical protein